jgi:outer membrane protein assembly factor BamB
MGLSGGILAVKRDGSVKWHYTGEHDDEWWEPPIDKRFVVDDEGQVFCSTRPDGLMSLDQDGEVAWRYVVRKEIGSPVLTQEGTVVAGGDNALCGFTKDGALIWEVIREGFFGPLAVGPEATVYCLFRRELSVEEQNTTDETDDTYPLPDRHETSLIAMDSEAVEKWRHEIRDNVLAGPVFASDGTLYLLCDNGWTHGDRVVLFAFDP